MESEKAGVHIYAPLLFWRLVYFINKCEVVYYKTINAVE